MAKIKICGIKSLEDIAAVNEAMPDYIGFVFAESKRHVDFDFACQLKSGLNKQIHTFGVFVNEDIGVIEMMCKRHIVDVVQIHGDEDEAYISTLRKKICNPIIKAVKVSNATDINSLVYNCVDFYLFDTYSKTEYGGTGASFDWNIIKGYKKPFFLAGGLTIGNVAGAMRSVHPYCVDVSSGVETNGVKDKQKMIDIVNLVRSVK